MAKDSGGHGSEARGEKVAMGQAVDERHFPTRSPADLAAAAKTLGQAHPKSAQVATHPAMSGPDRNSSEYHSYNRDLVLRSRNGQVGSGMKFRG